MVDGTELPKAFRLCFYMAAMINRTMRFRLQQNTALDERGRWMVLSFQSFM